MTSGDPKTDELVRLLLRPESYPHGPDSVEFAETHISRVFLAGDLVFKVKRPVRFPFLDYSTLARRLYFSREEVRLNRRLATDVYLGVVPILQGDGRVQVCSSATAEGHWPVVEWAVKMRRLPVTQQLDRKLLEGTAGRGELRLVARRLARFHDEAATGRAVELGTPDAVLERLEENRREADEFASETIPHDELRAIGDFYRRFVDEHRSLLETRLRNGRIREGHGDLRAEHVYLREEGQVDVVDCVEFNESFRTIDVASDLAFLVMDLEFRNEPLLARELVESYTREASDESLAELIPFYACHRAVVRGKVESVRSRDEDLSEAGQTEARLTARRYFRLALRYTRPPVRPAVVVVCGPAGTGKSAVAQVLGVDTGFSVVRSDVLRKRLAGLSPTERAQPSATRNIYTPEFHHRTYAVLHDEVERILARGTGVIADATFLRKEHRREITRIAGKHGLPVVFVECRASEATVRERLERRNEDPEAISDADFDIYRQQKRTFEPVTESNGATRVIAETDRDDPATIADRVRHLLS